MTKVHALRAGKLFDGNETHEDAAVLLDGERVREVLPVARVPEHIPVTDYGPNATILPGLIDAHVHLVLDASEQASTPAREVDDQTLLETMRRNASAQLAAGVTTVRDLGDRDFLALRLREEFRARPADGPELVCAGPPVTVHEGHCWFLGGETEKTIDSLRSTVAAHAERGVDFLKVMANGGTLSKNGSTGTTEQFTERELAALITAASEHDLPVAVHAHTPEAIGHGVSHGATTVEHGGFLTARGVDPQAEILAEARERGTVFSATAGFDPNGLTELTTRIMGAVRTGLEHLIETGVPLVIGTDAGLAPSKPHGVLPWSVRELGEAGQTPLAILRTLTSAAASACGIGNSKGRLDEGYEADILVVDGDPSTDPARLREPRAVYRRGTFVSSGS